MRPFAIIEPNAAARLELRNAVEDAGFRTHCFSDGAAALTMLAHDTFSLAIFGLDAADGDPFEICRSISRIVPLITVSSKCDAETCARALESGADDCVQSHLQPRELVARVRNVLRRANGEDAPGDTDLHPLSISLSEMRVRNGDAVHELSRGEADVLALFVEHAPRPLSATQIAEVLGANRSTVQSRIKSLRRKIGASRLATRAGFGYYLVKE